MPHLFPHRNPNVNNGKKTAILRDGRNKVHTEFSDGTELVEEFDALTDELLVRKWRQSNTGKTAASTEWLFEVGEPVKRNVQGIDLLEENVNNPIFLRNDTATHFVFRIRNLPYPSHNFSVTCLDSERCLVVRTLNKKYFKKIYLPDMDRKAIPFEESAVSWNHENNTLIIHYTKPVEVLNDEAASRQDRKNIKLLKEDDAECATQ